MQRNPKLTEQGVTYWIGETLKLDNHRKFQLRSLWVNVGSFIILCTVTGLFLWRRYKYKRDGLSQRDKKRNSENARAYIQLKLDAIARARKQNGLITNLPIM